MSVTEEKEFAMKHVFPEVRKIAGWFNGKKEVHFNVPWRIKFYNRFGFYIYLECMKFCGADDLSIINVNVNMKLLGKTGEELFVESLQLSRKGASCLLLKTMTPAELENYLIDGNLTIEMNVKLTNFSETREKLNNFYKSANKFSDVVLVVRDEKFHVSRNYLASHSPYFDSLFSGNFEESKQLEITLKDIDPYDFHNFLGVLHGEPIIDEDTVEGILKLADMYDSKTAIRRCEYFYMKLSEQSLKVKFDAAIKYKMDKLMKECISEMYSANDIDSVIPDDANDLDPSVWKELLKKSLSFSRY